MIVGIDLGTTNSPVGIWRDGARSTTSREFGAAGAPLHILAGRIRAIWNRLNAKGQGDAG